ncbi:hypothetical protein PFICI_15133 [Pestalotiopsis fici W106-1]|uniref:Xylanolytic transcriptional activator regulatory domain-containing protein n=1 Tax=Pestalotiopsis fici (strain W106-1 / CGMCC3.15140) TaxID=1229662 RepID=W3WH20_PESFW|nr:uncharacterized protein PFICI_15133 [Pestalotiopsis fici W106-1]ETS73188.1 hypothetical protein PFICI_15133 [Pestalotiopsis fici W106-1]
MSTAPCVLPPDEAAGYIKAYFECVHPLYPFLDRREFERKAALPNLIEVLAEQPAFSALYHAVLAIGCQNIADVSFDPGVGRSWQIFRVSLAILPRILTHPDSEPDLQAVTAMAIFGMNIPGMQVDELFIEAVRKAARIGCHRVIKRRGLDPVSCYKTFWVIYILERMLCFVFGLSPLLSDYDIGCPLPETPESNVDGVNFFLIAVRCGRIMSKAYQTLFSVSATMKTTEQYFAAIDAIKSDLSRWNYSIPAKFRPGMPFHSGNGWETLSFLRIHYMYHALNISLCRLELHVGVDQSTQRMNDTRKQLMNTARTVLDLTTFIELKPSTPMWIMCAIPASAMLILFDFVIHNPTHIETDTNLKLLDTAAGFFGRLQYATGGSFPSMIMSGFAHIASDYVRRSRAANGSSVAASATARSSGTPGNQPIAPQLTASMPPSIPNFAASTGNVNLNGLPPKESAPSLDVYSSSGPLFYPIEEGDYTMNDDLFAGFNFANFFEPVIPEF